MFPENAFENDACQTTAICSCLSMLNVHILDSIEA